MRRLLLLCFASFLLPASSFAQDASLLYKIEKDQVQNQDRIFVFRRPDPATNRPTLYVRAQFTISRPDGQPITELQPGEEIVVKEDGRIVKAEVVPPHGAEPLTTMLAIDKSGSMAEQHKMDEAKNAATTFLERLDAQAECGLILFDHALRVRQSPVMNRDGLRRIVQAVQPGGGTAYLDATADALTMLRPFKGRRAVLLMTDGVDLNSRHTMQEVTRQARAMDVPVYTIGVGEPGKNTPVTTVVVLDCSGSMDEPADNSDENSKMQALHRAAARFVDIMRPGARTTLLPFTSEVEPPKDFTADKEALKREIRRLEAGGETALFDATYAAVGTLLATRPEGRRAVVVLTDGKDNRSHHRVEEVIALARQAEVPLHMLGLGRRGELDEEVMERMGSETGGTYHHARNDQALYTIFEDLSIQLHDEGIDESALKQLAEATGGKYFPARDITQLRSIYEGMAQELQTSYTVTFPSYRQEDDGTLRNVEISIWRHGTQVSDELRGGYNRPGVIVPDMDAGVYLGLLGVLGVLLVLPAGLRHLGRRAES
jgi:VWFA-related protein